MLIHDIKPPAHYIHPSLRITPAQARKAGASLLILAFLATTVLLGDASLLIPQHMLHAAGGNTYTLDPADGTVSNASTTFLGDTISLAPASGAVTTHTKSPKKLSGKLFTPEVLPPDLAASHISETFFDASTSLLYVSTYPQIAESGGGLTVIDTGGNATTSDDTVVATYTTATAPAILNNTVLSASLDSASGLLYVSTQGGLSVIDTKKTVTSSDDTLAATYTITTTPVALGGSANDVHESFYDSFSGWLFVASRGLTIIDTKKTATSADDTRIAYYSSTSTPVVDSGHYSEAVLYDHLTDLVYIAPWTSGLTVFNAGVASSTGTTSKTFTLVSTPAISSTRIEELQLDPATGYLYIGAYSGGVTVLDTHKNSDPTDDTIVTTYKTTSSPSIDNNGIYHISLNTDSGLLYVPSDGKLSVINTQKTASVGDDTLVGSYSSALADTGATSATIDSSGLLYVSTFSGLRVIDTKETLDLSDDELVATYVRDTSSPRLEAVYHPFLDPSTGTYTDDTWFDALFELDPDTNTTVLTSQPIALADITPGLLTRHAAVGAGQSMSFRSRVGGQDAFWTDEFDDGDASNITDFYDWNFPALGTVTESGGTARINNPNDTGYDSYFWVDSNKGEDFFPANSVVKARVRPHLSNPDPDNDWIGMFSDEWENNNESVYLTNNEWKVLEVIPSDTFSRIGFEWDNSNPGDYLEIDWVSVEQPDSGWGSWTSACTSAYGCATAATASSSVWMQYEATLSADDIDDVPTLDSVSLSAPYASTGTYTSDALTIPADETPSSFTADVTEPANTTLTLEYSTDGTTWTAMTEDSPGNYSLPGATNTGLFRYRVTLSTDDTSITPTITNAVLTTDDGSGGGSGTSTPPGGGGGTTTPSTAPVLLTGKLAPGIKKEKWVSDAPSLETLRTFRNALLNVLVAAQKVIKRAGL